ncbi:MAG TPA: biotin--[acetyl-CoA-carboxylase] ligase [Ktedonobacterales bacterium]|nr:biotin--[acetyl-CoA-carboxylase] ligase [Ktedonobacterales bacterium]
MDEHDLPAGMPTRLPHQLDVDLLQASLAGMRLGNPLIYFPTIPSTNSHAAGLAREGAIEGTLVTTDDQTAGRGRVGRPWKALPGQMLALSLVLRPTFPPHYLVMAAALAVAEAIEQVTNLRPGIKWPNDVLVGERKVCGILIEVSDGVAILGIGLNVNGSFAHDPDLAARAITLEQAAGHQVSRESLLRELLRRLESLYGLLQAAGNEEAQNTVRNRWRARLSMLGQRVTVRQDPGALAGVAEDVTAEGALLVRLDDGTRRTISWGDVES